MLLDSMMCSEKNWLGTPSTRMTTSSNSSFQMKGSLFLSMKIFWRSYQHLLAQVDQFGMMSKVASTNRQWISEKSLFANG
jgi:hypothetical protein